ncbi:MAG TPA: hypothetical protein VGN16_20985 [Acidobacteriaceae bacterium]|jgi:hypothetical protein
MKTFQQIGTAAGALVEEKNRAYGSSFATAGAAFRLLYPDGIAPEQIDDALVLVRIWDKMKRIATDRDALGESPYADIIGYGILGVHMHQHRKEGSAPCNGSASDVPQKSKAQQGASAPSDASEPTTTTANGMTAKSSTRLSPPPSSDTLANSSVPVLSVMDPASKSAGDLESEANARNLGNLCGVCKSRLHDVCVASDKKGLCFCSVLCRDVFYQELGELHA